MNKVKKLFPIKTDRCSIKVLGYEDIEWYVDKVQQPFFNEFIDNKTNINLVAELYTRLAAIVTTYKVSLLEINDLRTVIRLGDKNIGGVTLSKTKDNGIYNLGYWLIPEYQGKGLAYEVLKQVSSVLEFGVNGIESIRLIIQNDNYKSIKLAEKTGYMCIGEYQGKIKRNLIYEYKAFKF